MRRRPAISHEAAMSTRPVRRPVVKTEEEGEKLCVTLEFERPRWQQMVGADRLCRRTFGLDRYGRDVYEYCDGKTTVKRMVARFAHAHHLRIAEAEVSVTAFLKTLMTKGLIGVPIEKSEL